MKCKICGHRTNSLPAMRKHYSKKHPGSMKHHTRKSAGGAVPAIQETRPTGMRFCPHCGGYLGG